MKFHWKLILYCPDREGWMATWILDLSFLTKRSNSVFLKVWPFDYLGFNYPESLLQIPSQTPNHRKQNLQKCSLESVLNEFPRWLVCTLKFKNSYFWCCYILFPWKQFRPRFRGSIIEKVVYMLKQQSLQWLHASVPTVFHTELNFQLSAWGGSLPNLSRAHKHTEPLLWEIIQMYNRSSLCNRPNLFLLVFCFLFGYMV
jgi:hypothetical protein